MVLDGKGGVAWRGPTIKQTATQSLIHFVVPPEADRRLRTRPSRTASVNGPVPILRPCASCGGSGLMNFIKQFEQILFAPHSFTFLRSWGQRTATLILVAAALGPPGVTAGELHEQEQQFFTQQAAFQLATLTPDERSIEPLQFKPLESRRLMKAEKEAKIQAQTAYLAAKFTQSESAIRQFVELAWEEAGKRQGMSPELLIAMMQKESSLRPKVESSYGAQGLMQVVRRWHHDKLHPSESLFDPAVNIRVGADVLEEYLHNAGGSLRTALINYSGNAKGYATRVLNESYALARVAAEAVAQTLASKG
jgi:hypothetical protein